MGSRASVTARAAAAIVLLAAIVTVTFAKQPAASATSSGREPAAISAVHDGASFEAAGRARPTPIRQRHGIVVKVLFALLAVLAATLLAAVATVRSRTSGALAPRSARREPSRRLRAPPVPTRLSSV